MPQHPEPLFLRTKVRVMRPPHGTIARPRLDAIRDQVLQVPLVTLTAPGGFGKSTLAASWVSFWQAQGLLCSWLSLSRDEDEPARFLHALAQALQRLDESVGAAALSLLRDRALVAPRAVLSVLLNDLEALDEEAVIVLDDWQWIQDPVIHDALAFFIHHAPPHVHVLITSRVTPALPLARLRAHGQWLDVDAAALRFDLEETQRLLGSVGTRAYTSAQVSALHHSTEGWVAALRLAALGHSLNGCMEAAGSGLSSVFASLFEDLLDSLPAEAVRFMAETAVLDELNADLCDASRARTDSAEHIRLLRQYQLLMEPIDGSSQGLHYHQLLREHLAGPVQQQLALDTRPLHQRAAHWFARHDQWSDAVRHAMLAGDQAQAIEWLAHCGMALVRTGDLLTLLGWRRQLPPELLASQPRVQLAVAWGLALAMRFEEADLLLDEIEQACASAPENEPAEHGTLCECLAIRAVNTALQDDSTAAGDIAEKWNLCTCPADSFTHNSVSNVMRYVHWKAGNLARVYEQPWQASVPDTERSNAFSIVYRHIILGSIELEKASLGLAERHAREALRCASEHDGPMSVSAALATPLMAQLHYQRGDWQQARELIEPLLPLIDNTAMHESVIQAYQVLVNAAQREGRIAQAFQLLERAEALGYNRGWDRVVGHMLYERIRLLVTEGRLDEANATSVRLKRLAERADPRQRSSMSDLMLLRDMALARLALANQHTDQAPTLFTRLLATCQDGGLELRAIQLGTGLALAHMAAGDEAACFEQLGTSLALALKSGAIRSVLDEETEIQKLLLAFLVSSQCQGELADFVRSLVAHAQVDSAPDPHAKAVLTERERRIIELVAQGRSNKEIARELEISAETVKSHLKNVFEKLTVQRRAQAVLVARSLGLIDTPA